VKVCFKGGKSVLQIISGKFFGQNERIVLEGRGVLYSNFHWYPDVELEIGKLRAVNQAGFPYSYVFEYKNQLEKDTSSTIGFQLVRTGDSVIIEQFKYLSFFGLRAYFSNDKNDVLLHCDSRQREGYFSYYPSEFAKTFFSETHGKEQDVTRFQELLVRVLALSRQHYVAVMNCLKTLYDSLTLAKYNMDLAYSMLVYCIETLAQRFDKYQPTWEDYDEGVRTKLDRILSGVNSNEADKIRKTLLESSHLKLSKRFTGFVTDHTSEEFFTTDAEKINVAVKRSHLLQSVKSAYNMRSSYVHSLEPLFKQLKVSYDVEYIEWDRKLLLTYNGLFRLTHHVISHFIYNPPETNEKDEQVDWRNELPGSVNFTLHPMFWFGKDHNPESARDQLEAYLSMWEEFHVVRGEALTLDTLSGLVTHYESILPQTNENLRKYMLSMYYIYNITETERPQYKGIINAYKNFFETCKIESLVVIFFCHQRWDWELDECYNILKGHMQRKGTKGSVKVPVVLEVQMLLHLGNQFLNTNDDEKFRDLFQIALCELPGDPDAQALISNSLRNQIPVDVGNVIEAYVSKRKLRQ
jgi:hypothetical protein